MTRSEDVFAESEEPGRDTEAITTLLGLMAELQIIDVTEANQSRSLSDGNPMSHLNAESEAEDGPAAAIAASVQPLHPERVEQAAVEVAPVQPAIAPDSSVTPSSSTSEDLSFEALPFESNTLEDDAFERLQQLLTEPKLAEVRPLIADLKQKLTSLEQQIYEPTELITLVMPWMAELLSRKIADSKEEVVQAIAPIIDQAIHSRIEQDKAAVASALAPVISATIARQINHSPEEVADAIAPMMGKAIQRQIRLEQDTMVDALYPIIGSTISKYMAEAIRSINEKIETTFSVEGLQRKIRAKMQGVSEAELILREAMPFAIQAVFLIDKTSGLVISEVQPGNQQLESEMVAGMLTAIRSFVNDCIAQSGNVLELDKIDYGNSKIMLEVAGYCYLAIVTQGEPPQRFVQKTRQTLGAIVQAFGSAIEKFQGNPATVPAALHSMLAVLIEAYSPEPTKADKPPLLLIGSLALLGLIAIPLGSNQYQNHINRQVESKTALALASTPALAVYRLDTAAHRGTLTLTGEVPNQALREKAEQVAAAAVPDWSLTNKILAVEVPPDPTLAAAEVRRVTAILNQMEGTAVSAWYSAGRVTVQGSVGYAAKAETVAQAFERIPGVRSVVSALQVQSPQVKVRFYFDVASAQLTPSDLSYKLHQVMAFLTQHSEKNLIIVGHSNPDHFGETQALAVQRAAAVRNALINQGIRPNRLRVIGTTQRPVAVEAHQSAWLSRCVEFQPVDGGN